MKSALISFVFLFVCFCSHAQVVQFQRTWYQMGNDYGIATQMPDSGYAVLCTLDPYTPNSKVRLIRTNIYGDTLWSKTFLHQNINVYGKAIISTNDNGIMVVLDSNNYLRTHKLDYTGNVLWVKNTGAFNLQKTYDNGFIASGGNALVKFDSLLNVQFRKFYGAGINDNGFPSYAIQTSDSGYAIVGQTAHLASGGITDRDVYIARTDKNGVLLWDRSFGHPSGIDKGMSVVETYDKGFIIAGEVVGLGAGSNDILLVRIDSSGNFMWSKTFGGVLDDYCYFIKKTTGIPGYYFGGATQGMESTYFNSVKTLLIKIDLNGNFLWGKLYGDLGNPNTMDVPNSFENTYDGGFMFCGTTYGLVPPQYTRGVWLIKTDNQGNSGCNEMNIGPTILNHSLIVNSGGTENLLNFTTITGVPYNIIQHTTYETILCTNHIITSTNEAPNKTNEFLIYPNPATTQITLQPQQPFKNAAVIIYNTLGAMAMQHQNIKGEKITIATNELPAGIYFITVLDEDKTYTSKLIIE